MRKAQVMFDRDVAIGHTDPRLLGAFDPLLLGWASRTFLTGAHAAIVTVNNTQTTNITNVTNAFTRTNDTTLNFSVGTLVMTPFSTESSERGTPHFCAAACSSISRALAPAWPPNERASQTAIESTFFASCCWIT